MDSLIYGISYTAYTWASPTCHVMTVRVHPSAGDTYIPNIIPSPPPLRRGPGRGQPRIHGRRGTWTFVPAVTSQDSSTSPSPHLTHSADINNIWSRSRGSARFPIPASMIFHTSGPIVIRANWQKFSKVSALEYLLFTIERVFTIYY